MGGVRQPDHGGVQAENNEGREFISGKTARESGVRGVWGGNSGWIHVESLDDSTREGRTTAAPLGPPDDWGAQDIQDDFPKGEQTAVPGGGMPGVSETRAAMRVHFVHRHVHDTVVILEEGNLPLPRCPRCYLQVSRKALNGRHLGTNQCRTGAERKIWRLVAAEGGAATERTFKAYVFVR